MSALMCGLHLPLERVDGARRAAVHPQRVQPSTLRASSR